MLQIDVEGKSAQVPEIAAGEASIRQLFDEAPIGVPFSRKSKRDSELT